MEHKRIFSRFLTAVFIVKNDVKTTNSNAHILSSGCGQIGAVTNVTSLKEPYGKALYSIMASPRSTSGESGESISEQSLSCSLSTSGSDESKLDKSRGPEHARSSPICPSLSRASQRKLVSRITTNPKLKSDGTIQTGRD